MIFPSLTVSILYGIIALFWLDDISSSPVLVFWQLDLLSVPFSLILKHQSLLFLLNCLISKFVIFGHQLAYTMLVFITILVSFMALGLHMISINMSCAFRSRMNLLLIACLLLYNYILLQFRAFPFIPWHSPYFVYLFAVLKGFHSLMGCWVESAVEDVR